MFSVNRQQAGDDVKTVPENLGNATTAFPLPVYAHITQKMKRESANKMDVFIRSVRDARENHAPENDP